MNWLDILVIFAGWLAAIYLGICHLRRQGGKGKARGQDAD